MKYFYSTKMSGNMRSLRRRFTAIRRRPGRGEKMMACVTALVLVLSVIFAAAALAHVSSDGTEYWTKDELYFVAGARLSARVSLDNMPQWVKSLSDDGRLSFTVNRVNIRFKDGWVRHSRIMDVSGDLGETRLLSNGDHFYAAVSKDKIELSLEPGAPAVIFKEGGDGAELWFATRDEDIMTGHVSSKDLREYFGDTPYIRISQSDIQYIGDYRKIEEEYGYRDKENAFLYFENNYINRHVEGFDIKIAGAKGGIDVAVDIDGSWKDGKINISVRKPEFILQPIGLWGGISRPVNEVNHSVMNITRQDYAPGHLESGETYVVDVVVTRYIPDREYPAPCIVYRRREYVTVP